MTEQQWLASDKPSEMLALLTANRTPEVWDRIKARVQRPSDRKLKLVCDYLLSPLCSPQPDYPTSPQHWLAGYFSSAEQSGSSETLPDAVACAVLLREIVGNPFRPLHAWESVWNKPKTARIPFPAEGFDWLWSERVERLAEACYSERGANGTLDADRLAVLSDCCEESGCQDADLLGHLRGRERCPHCLGQGTVTVSVGIKGGPEPNPDILYVMAPPEEIEVLCTACNGNGWVKLRGPHIAGCWAIDTILGRN